MAMLFCFFWSNMPIVATAQNNLTGLVKTRVSGHI